MTTTLIALQARMIQSSIAFWQAAFIAQKHWFEAMTRLPAAPEAHPHTPEAKDEGPAAPCESSAA